MNNGQRVLITGTSTGFGRLTAETLARAGHTVVGGMRDVAGRNAAAADGLRAHGVRVVDLDVTDEGSVNAGVTQAIQLAGGLDVVVNNAGAACAGLTEGFTPAQAQAIFDVNVFGAQRVYRAVLPHLREQHAGLVINISTGLARFVIPFMGIYIASKFALEALSESYRYELAPLGVDVVIVEPGAFPTEIMQKTQYPADGTRAATYGPIAEMPARMFGGLAGMFSGPDAPNPQEVADAVLKLVATPAGHRPLRTVVDRFQGQGPEAINAVSTQVQAGAFNAMGMGPLLGVKPRE